MKVGAQFDITTPYGPQTYEVLADDGATAVIGRRSVMRSGEVMYSRVSMPSASVKHFHDDLNGIVRGKPDSLVPEVNAVIRGDARKIDKGNDGIVYAVGDHIVKVSTTVPYQPENAGHRLPKEAIAHTLAEFKVHQRLENLLSVPPATFVEHAGRGWLVKPFMVFDTPMTKAELDQLSKDLDAMHAMGIVLGDELQVGRSVIDGRVYFSDLGQVRALRPNGYDAKDDKIGLKALYRKNGFRMGQSLEDLRRQLPVWQNMLVAAMDKGDVASALKKFPRWWQHAQDYADAVGEEEGGLARLDVQEAAWDILTRLEDMSGQRLVRS